MQEKKDRKKKPRLEKSEEEEEDDDDTEFIVDKFGGEEDFITFEDENEGDENAPHAENAEHARHDNLRTIIQLMTNSTREIFLMT